MAGLENYLSTLKDNAGMAGGYQQGVRDRTAQDTSLANLAQRQAETQRYTGETPSYLRRGEAQARTAELANAQGEADVSAGVPTAKAGQSLAEANVKAQQAQEEFNNWPAKHKLQLIEQTSQHIEKFNQLGLQLLQFSGSTGEAIQQMAQQYPDIAKDPQFTQWAKQYGNMPRDKAIAAFKFEMQKYASGLSTTREKFQTEALQEEQQQQGRMVLGEQRGQQGLAEAQIRATAGANKPTMATVYTKYLDQFTKSPEGSPEKEEARVILNLLKGGGTTTEESGIPGLAPTVKSKEMLPKGTGTTNAVPTNAAVKMLRETPSLRSAFDAKYGAGAAARYLGK